MEGRGFWENLFTFGGKEAYNKNIYGYRGARVWNPWEIVRKSE